RGLPQRRLCVGPGDFPSYGPPGKTHRSRGAQSVSSVPGTVLIPARASAPGLGRCVDVDVEIKRQLLRRDYGSGAAAVAGDPPLDSGARALPRPQGAATLPVRALALPLPLAHRAYRG